MNQKTTGGPAFPAVRIISGDNYNAPTKVYYGGMTLRDYFAAKAMQGLLSESSLQGTHDEFALHAYKMADAMLKAREAA